MPSTSRASVSKITPSSRLDLQDSSNLVKGKNQDIQILRAIAILLVVAQHYRGRLPAPAIYSALFNHVQFWPGVDIFFAISGFLIFRAFSHDLSASPTKMGAFKEFWIKRFMRLFPALLFWMIVSVSAAAFDKSVNFASPAKAAAGALAALVGVSNLYWSACIPNFTLCGSADFNGVTWSLSLEWQLYALLSFGIFYFGGKRFLICGLLLAVIMSVWPASIFSFPWAFRIQSFLLGSLTAYFIASRHMRNDWLRPWIAKAILSAGILIAILSPMHTPQPWVLPAISVGAALCLLSAIQGQSYLGSFFSKPLEWVGERSYSIYLCHLPIYLTVREIMVRTIGIEDTPTHIAIAVVFAVTAIMVFSDLSFRYIETPFQKLRASKRLISQRLPVAS